MLLHKMLLLFMFNNKIKIFAFVNHMYVNYSKHYRVHGLFCIKELSEKLAKSIENQLAEANFRLDESTRSTTNLTAQQSRLTNENNDLQRQLEEAESQINQLNRAKAQLTSLLEEVRNELEEQSRVSDKTNISPRSDKFELYSFKITSSSQTKTKSQKHGFLGLCSSY